MSCPRPRGLKRVPRRAPLALCVALALSLTAALASGDDIRAGTVELPAKQAGWPGIDDPIIRDMLALDAIAPFEDLAPLWSWRDGSLQAELDAALARLALDDDARKKMLSVDGDVAALAEVIRVWLTRHRRSGSAL